MPWVSHNARLEDVFHQLAADRRQGSPALYPEPPIPVLPIDKQVPVLEDVNK